MYGTKDENNGILPAIIWPNHSAPNVRGPKKDDWTKECPMDGTDGDFATRMIECFSMQEALYGTALLCELQDIKERVDQDEIFTCPYCIKDKDTYDPDDVKKRCERLTCDFRAKVEGGYQFQVGSTTHNAFITCTSSTSCTYEDDGGWKSCEPFNPSAIVTEGKQVQDCEPIKHGYIPDCVYGSLGATSCTDLNHGIPMQRRGFDCIPGNSMFIGYDHSDRDYVNDHKTGKRVAVASQITIRAKKNGKEVETYIATRDAELFVKDPTWKIQLLLKETLDLVEEERADPESEYSKAVLCNVETLLQVALVDDKGVVYAVNRALSQLDCSPGDSDLCDKLFEANHFVVMDEVKDEL